MARLKVSPGTWFSELLRSLGVVYKPGFELELGDVVVPVYSVNPGDVALSVAPFADEWTETGKAHFARGSAGPVVGQMAYVQLFNPSASGVRLYVDGGYNALSGSHANIALHNVDNGGAAGSLGSKYAGGTASVATVKTGTAAAVAGTVVGDIAINERAPFAAPFILNPGFGLTLWCPATNVQIVAGFEFRELAI